MTNSLKTTGGKRPKRRQHQQQNQNGGACGNSSSVAASYGGSVPMLNVQQGGSGLVSTPYNQGGNVNLMKGGASLLPQMGGNPNNPLLKGGAGILPQMSQMGGSVPGILPTGTTTGGNVLNELAVPAVLLYANNTFGKKKRYTGKRTRRSGKGKGKKSRRYRRR